MSKESDLEQLGFHAVLRPVAEWLEIQGRLSEAAESLDKAATVAILATKLTREQVDQLLERREAKKSPPEKQELAVILGLPQKEAILARSSKQDLRGAMEALEREGRVGIAWKSQTAEELRDYLRQKCSKELAAELLWGIAGAPVTANSSNSQASGSARGSSPSRWRLGLDQEPPSVVTKSSRGDASPLARDVEIGHFGGYELLEQVRGGGMSEAWKARDSHGAPVFIKRVRNSDQTRTHSLEREARIYEKLSRSPLDSVLDVHTVFREGEWFALVTELADGGDLDSYVAARAQLPHIEAHQIAWRVITALRGLAELQIVHRDLKPKNIVRVGRHWKLADFGIAKNLDRLITEHTLQGAHTAWFSAPEQIAGIEAHSSADMFSFGRLLMFLATGREQLEPPSAHPWSEIARGCVALDPRSRPTAHDAAEFFRSDPA